MSSSSAVTSPSPSPSTSSSPETHSCPYADCNKSFSKKYNLKAHLRLHTGEQPFECDRPDCRKKFKWRSSLSSHSVWHSRKDNAASSAPNVTKPPTTSKSNSQKSGLPRAARVAAQAPPQQSDSQISFSSASASNVTNRKKRPRSEVSGCSTGSAQSAQKQSSGTSSTSRLKSKSKGSAAKKQRRTKTCGTDTTGVNDGAPAQNEDVVKELKEELEAYETSLVDDGSFEMMPGSPVTSDGSMSEAALEADDFPCDILQPLLSRGDTLELGTDTDVLFGYEEAGCGSLTGFDTRFDQLDLDNFGNLYLNRLESL